MFGRLFSYFPTSYQPIALPPDEAQPVVLITMPSPDGGPGPTKPTVPPAELSHQSAAPAPDMCEATALLPVGPSRSFGTFDEFVRQPQASPASPRNPYSARPAHPEPLLRRLAKQTHGLEASNSFTEIFLTALMSFMSKVGIAKSCKVGVDLRHEYIHNDGPWNRCTRSVTIVTFSLANCSAEELSAALRNRLPPNIKMTLDSYKPMTIPQMPTAQAVTLEPREAGSVTATFSCSDELEQPTKLNTLARSFGLQSLVDDRPAPASTWRLNLYGRGRSRTIFESVEDAGKYLNMTASLG